jgi:hypothetical protein
MIKYIVSFFSLCFFALSSGPSIYIFCPPAAWPPLLLSCRAVHSAGRGGSLPRAWLGERLPSGCGRPCRPARTMPTLLPSLISLKAVGWAAMTRTARSSDRPTRPVAGGYPTNTNRSRAVDKIVYYSRVRWGGSSRSCGVRAADSGQRGGYGAGRWRVGRRAMRASCRCPVRPWILPLPARSG